MTQSSQPSRRFTAKPGNAILSVLLCVACGCQSAPRRDAPSPQIGWRTIASFSGRGDSQTESFDIDSTQWRIKWLTKGATSPGVGTFHVVVHSAVSGRPIMDAVDQHGDGHGLAYVTEDPRLYHLVIDSQGVDWSISVQEAVVGVAQQPHP